MNRAAELDVRLTRKGGTLHAAIASSRTSVPPALVRGKSPEEVASLLPRLFAVCALAQGSAAAAACEAAMASETDPARSARRDFLAAAEAIREHLFRLVLGAAETLGEAPDPRDLDHLRLVTTALRQASGDIGPSDWRRISGGISSALASQIDAHFHRPEASGAYDAFLAWLDQAASPFARLCGRLHERGDDRLGAENDCQPGGDLDPAVIGARLLGPDGPHFARYPSVDGHAQETTAFSRRRAESLIGALGDGLLARLVARQLDAIRLAENLPSLAKAAEPAQAAFRPAPGRRQDGDGAAAVETARGRLIHAVRLRGGRVEAYRILAPTEWNFHPGGPVARRLARLAAEAAPQEIDRQARLLIDIFDPCIPYRLSVQ